MDEYTFDAYANRDEPVPLLMVTPSDVEGSSSDIDSESRQARIKSSLSASKLKAKAQDIAADRKEKLDQSSTGRLSLQDRLFAKYNSALLVSN